MRNYELMKYAGMATQFMATLGVAFFLGIKIDKWSNLNFPIATICLPLLMLIYMLWKIVKESNTQK